MKKTITVHKFNWQEKQGRKGKFYKIGIKTVDKNGQETWFNGLADGIPQWKEGQQVELDISTHEQYGLQFAFLNLGQQQTLPGVTREEFKALQDRVHCLETALKVGKNAEEVAEKYGGEVVEQTSSIPPMPEMITEGHEDYIAPEDIPF